MKSIKIFRRKSVEENSRMPARTPERTARLYLAGAESGLDSLTSEDHLGVTLIKSGCSRYEQMKVA